MEEGDTILNAVIGAAVSFVTANFVPFSPVLGGGIAGYLEGGSRRNGTKVGAISGLIAFVPFLVLVFAISTIVGVVGLGVGLGAFGPADPGAFTAGIVGLLFFAFFLVMGFLYFVGGGALGGWLGNYLKYDTDIDF